MLKQITLTLTLALIAAALTTPAAEKESVTYCGISTSEVTPALAQQLKLPKGIGLVVDYLEPGGPAEKAGVKEFDILTSLDDQRLANQEQFRVLIQMKKAGESAKLTVVRQGQTIPLEVKLGQHPATPDNAIPQIGQKEFHMTLPIGGPNPAMLPRQPIAIVRGGGAFAVSNVNGPAQSVWADGQHTLTSELKNGKAAKLTIKDSAGKELFNGPVETPEQRKALPPDLAEKLEKMETNAPHVFWDIQQINSGNRILTSTDKDTLLLAKMEEGKAIHLFAFSTATGKTLFEGPTTTDDQRKSLPQPIANQLEVLEKNQQIASEFGLVGRN